MEKHNTHSYGTHRFTAKTSDWKLFLFIEADDFKQALKIEKKIKAMKSKAYFKNLLLYPDLVQKLKQI